MPQPGVPEPSEARDALKREASEFLKVHPSQLIRPDLTTFSIDFSDISNIFDLNYMFVSALTAGYVDALTDEQASKLLGYLTALRKVYGGILKMDRLGDPRTLRASLVNSVKPPSLELGCFVLALLPKLSTGAVGAEKTAAADETLRQTQETLRGIAQAKSDADAILESLRTVASEVGITKYATIFGNEAGKQGRQSWWWATGALIFGGVAAICTLFFFEPHIRSLVDAEKPLSNGIIVSLAVSRAILISLLYLAVVWCIRNFSAARHNAVVNRHRQNALSTFEAFVKAAEGDPQTKNAVLLQATQSIFAPQASGYLKGENDGPAASPVIEIVRGLSSPKGE
jgi:hypothetical protein